MAYTFTNIINPADPTFNQVLGINNSDVIAGYNGSGVPGHPNQGYTTTTAGTTIHPREFSGIGADPGRRHQQQGNNGRFLFPHQQRV